MQCNGIYMYRSNCWCFVCIDHPANHLGWSKNPLFSGGTKRPRPQLVHDFGQKKDNRLPPPNKTTRYSVGNCKGWKIIIGIQFQWNWCRTFGKWTRICWSWRPASGSWTKCWRTLSSIHTKTEDDDDDDDDAFHGVKYMFEACHGPVHKQMRGCTTP